LVSDTDSGGCCLIDVAIASAESSSDSAGTTLVIRPIASASAAEKIAPSAAMRMSHAVASESRLRRPAR
jgi:hypothetical protein